MVQPWVLMAVVATFVVGSAPVDAAPGPVPSVALAGPGGFAVGFATPVVPMLQGGTLTFVNTDVAPHNVRSRATVPKRVRSGKGYKTIRVPLFVSQTVGLGGSADVVGVNRLKPGSYAFICSIHPNMAGQLQVQAAP